MLSSRTFQNSSCVFWFLWVLKKCLADVKKNIGLQSLVNKASQFSSTLCDEHPFFSFVIFGKKESGTSHASPFLSCSVSSPETARGATVHCTRCILSVRWLMQIFYKTVMLNKAWSMKNDNDNTVVDKVMLRRLASWRKRRSALTFDLVNFLLNWFDWEQSIE